jgi:hypothetical protein
MNGRRKEADGPNLCEPKDIIHPIREITDHKGKMQGTSSHKPG